MEEMKSLQEILKNTGKENLKDARCNQGLTEADKIRILNELPGTLTGYDCPKCKNRGYVMVMGPTGSMTSRQCSCMFYRSCLRKLRESGLGNNLQKHRLEAYHTEEPWQETVLTSAEAYLQKPEGWFLISGQSGSGKTHICDGICRQLLLKGRQVKYLPWTIELEELKNFKRPEVRDGKIAEYKNAEILYIDDFLKVPGRQKTPSQADLALGMQLIGARYLSEKITILSTEYTPAELLNLDEALGSRILELAGKNVIQIKRDPSRNYRLKGGKEV